MNKKINLIIQSCFIIVILMMTIISSVITQGGITTNTDFSIQTEEILVPTWKKNDTWTYFVNIDATINEDELEITCEDLLVKVIEVEEEVYKIRFFGDAYGSGEVSGIGEIERFAGTMQGDIDLRKDFSVKHINNTVIQGSALVIVESIPVILNFEVAIDNVTITPEIQVLSFPLFVGKNWSTPVADLEVHGGITIESEYSEINITQPSAVPVGFFNCTGITTFYLSKYGIDVLAYNISEEFSEQVNIMYSPFISSIVSASCNNLEMGDIVLSADIYLKNSSYIEEATEISINLVKPKENTIYFLNNALDLFQPLTTFIVGEIDIESEVQGGLGDINVSFYLDDKCIETLLEPPYKFILDETIRLGDRRKIRVVATDNLGREDEDYIYANILNFGFY